MPTVSGQQAEGSAGLEWKAHVLHVLIGTDATLVHCKTFLRKNKYGLKKRMVSISSIAFCDPLPWALDVSLTVSYIYRKVSRHPL